MGAGRFETRPHGARLLLSLLLAVAAIPAHGQVGSSGIAGRVVDAESRRPIAHALVQLRVLDRTVETDSVGAFTIPNIPAGFFAIRVIRIGYAPVERNLNVMAGRVTMIEYALTAEAAVLPEVSVSGKPEEVEGSAILAGFEERRKMGGGTFLDEATLTRYATRRMSDVLRGAANLRMITDNQHVYVASNRQLMRSMRPGANGPCYLDIIVDGQLIWAMSREGETPGARPPNINDIVNVAELAATEIYGSTASIPLKYRSIGNACGALMFWTKRGLPAGEPPRGK